MTELFSQQEIKFNRLNLDYIKKNDLKLVFEILMSEPESRTIADINALAKIFLNIDPIKKINNFSAIYHICRAMFLAKFKQKSFVYQKQEEAECLYLILNGKIGLYKRQSQQQDQEEVVFLSEGNCFGAAYNWKQRFLPLTFQQTLLAIIPKREITKLTVQVAIERQDILKTIKKAKLFGEVPEESLKAASQHFTLHRVPFGTYLIKQGQIPKALYYLLKGTVKKQLILRKMNQDGIEILQKKQLSVATYSSGDFFPKQNLSDCLTFNIVAQSPCQVISIPKKALKLVGWSPKVCESQWKDQEYYKQQMIRQQLWLKYKSTIISQTVTNKPKKLREFF